MRSKTLNQRNNVVYRKVLSAIILILIGWISKVDAQLAPKYPLVISSGTYSSISGTGTALSGVVGDDVGVNVTGFTAFNVNGVNYTNARMNSNGWLALYTTTAPTATSNYATLSTAMVDGAVIFAPFGRDLNSKTGTGAYWQTIGDEIVFEWKSFVNYGQTNELNFQVRLNTATGAVVFVYGTMTPSTLATYPQVGWKTNGTVAGNWTTDINNLMLDVIGSPNTCNWSNVVTGNLNTSTVYFNSTNPGVVPTSGLTYAWSKPNGTDPDPVRTFAAVSGITSNSAILNWTAPTGATQYNVRYRVVGSCSWTNFSGNPVSSPTATLTGLSAGTYYQVQVQSSNGSVNTIWSHIPNTAGNGSGYITTGTFQTTVTCPAPTATAATSITTTTANANWSPATGNWIIEYGPSATFTPVGTGATAGNANNIVVTASNVSTKALSGLQPSTGYSYVVRQDCTGAGNGYSANSGTINFTTDCIPINTYPYLQSFSATMPACWSASEDVTGASQHWKPTTADATYGAPAPQSGTHFMYLYCYLASTTYNRYNLNTGSFALGATPKSLSYYYYLGPEGYTTSPVPMTVRISSDGGATWTDLFAHTSGNSTMGAWTQNVLDLSAYVNKTVIFRFASNSNYGSTGKMDQGIDEFFIFIPCPDLSSSPSNVSIINSICASACTVSGGSITAPTNPCPAGASIQYRVNGGSWSSTLPVYAQSGPAQTIETRCSCDADPSMVSPASTPVTTVPGTCTNPTAGITNNSGTTVLTCTQTSINVTATGGGTYAWSGGATPSTAANTFSTAATYTVTVTGANGCTATASITITENKTPPTAGITNNSGTTVLTCTQTSINVTATGGGTYAWSGGATPSTAANTFTTAATYTVTVTGTNGCTATASITITENKSTPAQPVITIVDNVCPAATGSISASGCGAGTTLEWSTDGVSWSTTTPSYTTVAFTLYARCVDNTSGCASTSDSATTAPTDCGGGGSYSCFIEDFSSITGGNNTTTGGSSTAWTGNTNFPVVVKAYQAGGAVRLGNTTTPKGGSIESKALTGISGTITVNIKVKGWTTVEGGLTVSIDGQSQSLTYSAKINDPFEQVTAVFNGVTDGKNLLIATSGAPANNQRCFIDEVEIVCAGGSNPVTISISDPCVCNNDATIAGNAGTFNEQITVTGSAGQIITGTCTGCTPASLTFTEGPAGTYVSNTFKHIDNTGYTATIFENGTSAGTISNKCAYPDAAIDPMGPFTNCINVNTSYPMTATITGDNGSGTYVWSGPGVSGSNFNPSGLPAGNKTIHLNYTGVDNGHVSPDGGTTPAYPGCLQPDESTVVVNDGVAKPEIDDIAVCDGESTLIVAPALSTTTTTNSFTWDFEGGINKQGVSSNTSIAGNAPIQTVGSGIAASFQTAGSGCTDAISLTAFDIANSSLADAIADAEYIEFCVGSAQSGVTYKGVNSINWIHRRSGTGPISWALVPVSNLNNPVLSGMISGTSCIADGGSITPNPSETCYRIYYWGATNTTGTLRISDFVINADYEVAAGTYNFYLVNPVSNPGATPVATGLSYDPGTTVVTSPQTIWVTVFDSALNCESLPDSVKVTVNPNPKLSIVQPPYVCKPGTVNVLAVNLGETPTGGTKKYYPTNSDAVNKTNEIISGLNAVSQAGTIYVRYELSTGCYAIGGIIVDIRDLPAKPSVPDSLIVCQGESTRITIPGGAHKVTTTWDFESGITGQGITSDPTISTNGPTQIAGAGLQTVIAQPAGSGCSASISATGFDITNASLADAITAGDYFEFCVGSPVGGYTFTGVDAINWGHRRSNTGPLSWALVTANNPGTAILTGTITGTNCSSAGGAIPLNTATCYRIYYWGASNITGTLRIDNFAITGNYTIAETYNWYNVDPDANPMATPVATGNSYDPMTTPATSPQSIWVNVDNGCKSKASKIVIVVIATPTVNSIPNQSLCSGASTNAVNFSGTPAGVKFSWTNSDPTIGLAASGVGNIASFVAINNTGTTKVATITVTPSYTFSNKTCTGTPRTFTITVYPLPVPVISCTENSGLASNDCTICAGDQVVLSTSGGGTYAWSNGQSGASISVSPTTTTTYTVTVTSVNNCTGTARVTITVNPKPTVTISVTENSGVVPNDGIIYTGSSATLTATGGGTYLWNTGATTASITVTPPVTTTYTVTVTNAFGCSTTAQRIITVVDPPCHLVCSQDQTVTLGGGECEYQLANLVTQAGDCKYFKIEQVSGPKPGDFLSKGKYEIKYRLVSNLGEIIKECTFNVTVQGQINTYKNLVCNDYLNVSADGNCQVSLNAGMFLEGSNYGCYSDYIIKVWPFGYEANKYEIKQNTALNIPLGEHMYEIIDPVSGNRCWGSFKVEDKLAPVAQCSCEDKDIITPVTQFTGVLEDTDPLFNRCGASFTPQYYDVKQFEVSATGSYTFTVQSSQSNDLNCYIYSNNFDANNPCTNVVVNSDPNTFTVTLTAGIKYYFVYTTYWEFDYASTYPDPYTITITSQAGTAQVVQNASTLPECQFKCYDLPTVQAETVSMLYKFPGEQNKAVLTTPPAVTDACGGVDRTFVDRYEGAGNCASGKLERTWTFTDASGNQATCTQTFTFSPLDIVNDLTPPNPEVHMSCGQETSPADVAAYFDVDSRPQPASATNIGAFADDWAQTPSVVELNEGYAYGYFTWPGKGFDGNLHAQKVDNAVCNVFVSYTDDMLPACGLGCGGNMKVIRTWKLLDWCTGQVFQYIQVIKAVDEKAPTFDVKDLTISVDAWVCSATWVVEKPWELQDNCAKPSELKWGVYAPKGTTLSGKQPDYVINNLPKGVHQVRYWAEDCCGNRSEKIAYITVVDATAPVAIAKQNIVLSLTGGNTSGDGVAKLFGWQVDNGSYDQCSRVKLEIRRLDGGACNNIGADGKYNNNSTYNNHNGLTSATPGVTWLHPDDNVNDTDGGEYVKFCCADIAVGEEFGIHQAELRVWDDGNMNGIIGDNQIINGVKDNYNTTWADIRVENKIPPQIVCPADVSVTCDMDINLSIGKDTWVDTVNMTMTGLPKSVGICNQAKITYKDAGSLDDCRRGTITRTFTATIGSKTATCTQKITISYIKVPFTVTFAQNNGVTKWDKCSFTYADARSNDPRIKKPIVNYGQCDIVGESISIDTFLFEDGACKKWKVTYNYKNWCTGDEVGPFVHYYAFKDEVAPIVVCKDQEFPAVPPAPGNPLGACEGSVILEASASDALICAEESWIKWQVFFDGWANGTVDRLGSSFVNKAWANQWVAIPRLINGQPNPTWVQLQAQHTSVVLEDLVYVTYVKPTKASGESVKLPAFTLPAENIHHKIFWKVTDGCGNVDQCQSTVLVVDKKAPTPYCVHISTAIMQTNPKMVELWAKDFDKGAFDNCTPQNKLYFTFDEIYPVYSKLNVEHYFKAKAGQKEGVDATLAEYNQGRAQKWIPSLRSSGKIWTSAGVTNIKVSVWDEAWNTDFCEVELKIIDNGGGSRPVISGTVATATGDRLNDATVTIDAQVNEYPKSVKTDARGNYSMENPATLDYTVNASKGGDYLNGVTTLDLVIIQRHILGMEILNDNYKIVAADANNDRKVTAQDLTEIRKVILGVSDRFTNESWRFPVAGTAVSTSPIAYTEEIQIDNLTSDVNGNNFVAVKIGDVNGSADLNLGKGNVEARSTEKVELNVAEMNVVAGELVEIPVTAGNFNNVAGFQYTMNLKGASYVSIQKGAIEMSGANVGNLGDGVVTMSYAGSEGVTIAAGEVLFTLVVRADKATKMSEILSLNSGVTKAESYNGDLKVGGIELAVRTAEVASIELYQNEPNPFKGQTTVSFMMPEAGAATLTVYDMTGKQVVVRNISAVKGLNSEVFTRDQIGVSGVMYYTLESGDFTATKKMIIVE